MKDIPEPKLITLDGGKITTPPESTDIRELRVKELLADGSKQKDIWGAGFEPYTQKITYDSLINIRAPQNRSMEISDSIIRERVTEIVIELLGGI